MTIPDLIDLANALYQRAAKLASRSLWLTLLSFASLTTWGVTVYPDDRANGVLLIALGGAAVAVYVVMQKALDCVVEWSNTRRYEADQETARAVLDKTPPAA